MLAIILLVLILLALLLLTPVGVKVLASTADSSLEQLTVKGVSGSLLTGLHIDRITWADGDSISLKNVDLKLQQYNTNRGRLVADLVSVGHLNINVIGGGSSSGGDITELPNFGLPLNMNAHLIKLSSLTITKNVPDDPGSRTLLFQVRNIELKKVTISDGLLRFRKLLGNPIIMDAPLKINVSEGRLNMNQPHDLKTGGSISFKHELVGEIKGSIQLAGTLTNYNFEGEVNHQKEELGKQTINFLGQGDYKRVHVEKLNLDSQHGKIEAKGRVLWDPELRWVFLLDGKGLSTKRFLPAWPAEVNGQLRLSGNIMDGHLENNVNILSLEGMIRGYELKLDGRVSERQGVLKTEGLQLQLGDNKLLLSGRASEPFDLKWDIDANDIAQALPENMRKLNVGGSLKGRGILKGELSNPVFNIKLVANNLVYEDIKQGKDALILEGSAALLNSKVVLKGLSLKSGSNQISVTGKASEPFDLNWTLKAKNLKQLSPQLAGEIKGIGSFQGTIKQPEFQVKLEASKLAYQDFKQGKETLILEGGLVLESGVIQLKKLIARSGDNKIEASGQASEPMNLRLKISGKDLAQVSPDLAGKIEGEGSVTGDYKSPIMKTNLVASNLRFQETKLLQSQLRIEGEVQIVDGVPIIKEVSSQLGNNTLRLSGRASSPFDLSWNIEGKNLNQLMPELTGQITANGKLQGTIDNPIINAKLDAKRLKYKDFNLGSAKLIAQTENSVYHINGDLNKLQGAGQKVKQAKFELNGRIENHTIKLSVDHQEAKLRLKANGGWQKQQWTGALQNLSLNETVAGDWSLQKPTQLKLSKESFSNSQLCLVSKNTQVCSTASWSKLAGLKAKGALQKTPLSLLKPWLPEGISLNGSVNGSYDVQQHQGKPKGVVTFKLPDSNFSFKDADGEEQTLAYKNAKLEAKINNRDIKAKVRMEIVNRGNLSSDVKIKLSPENGKHTIDGSAKFDIPNINWAQNLIPRSRGLRGSFASKITFKGLLTKPKIVGKASLINAYLRLPEAGTELTNININIRADKSDKAILKGKMFMGKGALNISGDLDLRNVAKWKANVKIKGNDIRFMKTNEINATMSPDLNISITPKVVSILGKVKIPEAFINLKNIPETSIDETSDAYVVGEKKKGENISVIRLQPNVMIELGDKVRINAFDLRAKLSGSVKITNNKQDILANGSLRVTEGKYQAYGQDLSIENGRLIFNGSPKLIGMDIRATRKVDKTIVGVHLGGNLRHPKSTIFSDPTLPESEALSFLITGHSLSTSSGRESALLMSAVRGLGITGNNSLIHNIGASLGLDDVNIVSNEDFRKSELALGKRLGSKLYVRYLVGLFDQTQKIAVEYKINKVLSLEAQTTADDFGLDFIYEIERD